jgi:hypothetical protein
MGIRDKAKRQKFQERAATKGWTGVKAAEFIQVQLFKAKRSTGGRPFAAPRNLSELVQQVERHHEQSLRRYAIWRSFAHEWEQKASRRKANQQLQKQVGAACKTLGEIAREARELAKQLESFEKNDSSTEE